MPAPTKIYDIAELRAALDAIAGVLDSEGPYDGLQPKRWWRASPRMFRCGRGHVGTGSHTCTGTTSCAWSTILTFPGDRTGDLPEIEASYMDVALYRL